MQLEGAQRGMRAATSRELDGLERNLEFLANVGSISPYVGLFGTVWGIMHAFRGLANMSTATLSAVAPGIAEALVATAMGLFAAIPAVWAYNRYATRAERMAVRYETFAEEFSLDPAAPGPRGRLTHVPRKRKPAEPQAKKLKAEINVVPYIDVMLVLLIIFMVTAPLLNVGVDVNLPQANAKALEQRRRSR